MNMTNFNKIFIINFFYHKNFFSSLVYLLPLALLTGPFIPDLFLSLVGLYFLILSLTNKLWNYYKNPFVYIFTIFYFYLIIRSIFSSEIFYSLQGCLFYCRYLFFSLAVFYFYKNIQNFGRNLGLITFITLIVVGLDAYIQWIFGSNIFGWSTGRPDRLAGFFRDELIIGGYLARLTPLCLGLLICSLKITRTKLLIGLFFLIFIDVITFGSGERAAFFFITLFSILLIFLSNNYKLYRLLTFIVSCILIVIVTYTVPASNEKVRETLNQTTTNTIVPLAPYSPLHEEHYIVGLKMFNDNLIFGKGPNMFDILCKKAEYYHSPGGCTTHPHNSYIQLLSETGIVGTSFLVLAFLVLSFLLFKHFLGILGIINYNLPDHIVFFLAGLFIMTWPLIPTGSFFNNWTNVMYYFPVGFVLYYFYKDKVS